jgi:hypothetical protein
MAPAPDENVSLTPAFLYPITSLFSSLALPLRLVIRHDPARTLPSCKLTPVSQ